MITVQITLRISVPDDNIPDARTADAGRMRELEHEVAKELAFGIVEHGLWPFPERVDVVPDSVSLTVDDTISATRRFS